MMLLGERHKGKSRWLSVLTLVAFSIFALNPAPSYAQNKAYSFGHYFRETNQAVGGGFWEYWVERGQLAQQGYPISQEFVERSDTNGKDYLVQYFERAVFEWHPETPKTPVLLSLLGNFLYKQKYPNGAPGQKPNTTAGSVLFKETGKRLGGKFLQYWNTHGGLPQQGFPISDEFQEKSPTDGKTYTVQYFERAVFEYHPEQKDPNYQVLLSLLGSFHYAAKYQSNLKGKPGDTDGDSVLDDANGNGTSDVEDDQCPWSPENFNKIFDADGCPDTLQTLVIFAAEDINSFWVDKFKQENAEYAAPEQFIAYNEPIDTPCGPALLNNAFYCSLDHSIYYHYDFLIDQLNSDGDFAPVTILAHEWGHLVQGNLGFLQGQYLTIQTELQADCFAGAWALHAGEMGYLEEGDLDEGANSLFKAGDDIDFPWFKPGAHGQPEERIDAFVMGLENGPDACLEFTP
ncbi:MAG TPA: neutral zinc metallopeptidase [Chloroflexia bacterium]|nr:neutral zinc metallopeptidase [Chloroflexia bacterium]